MMVAPFNMQVNNLKKILNKKEKLGLELLINFQGQESK